MSLISTAVLFFLVSLLSSPSPAYACVGDGCDAATATAIGLGVAAHVGIAIGVILLVSLVVCLVIMQHRKKLQQAQANGTKPIDIERQGSGSVPTSELDGSQATIVQPTLAGGKDFEEVKDF